MWYVITIVVIGLGGGLCYAYVQFKDWSASFDIRDENNEEDIPKEEVNKYLQGPLLNY